MRQNARLLAASMLLSGVVLSPVAFADSSVQTRLDARGVKYEVDADGDYKVTYSYKSEGRTQLVFVSGKTESVGGVEVRAVVAPAGEGLARQSPALLGAGEVGGVPEVDPQLQGAVQGGQALGLVGRRAVDRGHGHAPKAHGRNDRALGPQLAGLHARAPWTK